MEDQYYSNERKEAIKEMCDKRKEEIKNIQENLKARCKEIGKLIAERDFHHAMQLDEDSQYNELCAKIQKRQNDHEKEMKAGKKRIESLEKERATLTDLLN